jgi:ABC-type transporter lipoprotein component MlaA
MPRIAPLLLLLTLLLGACAGTASGPATDANDPLEPANRQVHDFNMQWYAT